MRRQIHTLLTALSAAAVLAAAVTSASAGRLSIRSSSIRAVWSSLNMTNTVTAGTVRCPVTLEGSFFSASIRKIVTALVGRVTTAKLNNGACTGGNATLLQEALPWRVAYGQYLGVLPSPNGIRFELYGLSVIVTTGGNTCRATSSIGAPAGVIAELFLSGQVHSLRADEIFGIPLTNGPGGLFCGLAELQLTGTGNPTALGTTTLLTITLI